MKRPEPFYARETTAVYSKDEMDEYLQTLEPRATDAKEVETCSPREIAEQIVEDVLEESDGAIQRTEALLCKWVASLVDSEPRAMDSLSPEPTMPWTPAPDLPRPNVSTPSAGPPVQWKHWTPEPVLSRKPRPSVLWFAERMEAKLRENDHKGGWNASEFSELLVLLEKEVAELGQAAFRLACLEITDSTIHGVIDEAVDVANFAMMIADNARTYKKALEVQVE